MISDLSWVADIWEESASPSLSLLQNLQLLNSSKFICNTRQTQAEYFLLEEGQKLRSWMQNWELGMKDRNWETAIANLHLQTILNAKAPL